MMKVYTMKEFEGMQAVKAALEKKQIKNHCIIEGLETCLYNSNSKFDLVDLLQTMALQVGSQIPDTTLILQFAGWIN